MTIIARIKERFGLYQMYLSYVTSHSNLKNNHIFGKMLQIFICTFYLQHNALRFLLHNLVVEPMIIEYKFCTSFFPHTLHTILDWYEKLL